VYRSWIEGEQLRSEGVWDPTAFAFELYKKNVRRDECLASSIKRLAYGFQPREVPKHGFLFGEPSDSWWLRVPASVL
jgi:hypothetical protein